MISKLFTFKYSLLNNRGKKEQCQIKVKATNVREAREVFIKEIGDQIDKVTIISITTVGSPVQ